MSLLRNEQATLDQIAQMSPEEALNELCARVAAPRGEIELLSLRIQQGLLSTQAEQVSNTDQ